MIELKEGRFWLGKVSVPFVEGAFLETENETIFSAGFQLTDRSGSWRICILLSRSASTAKEDSEAFYVEGIGRNGQPPVHVTYGCLSGYRIIYHRDYGSVADMTFDMGDAEAMGIPEWDGEAEGACSALLSVQVTASSKEMLRDVMETGTARQILEGIRVEQR